MDYTRDAIEFDRRQWARALMERLGPMAPGNSLFSSANLNDSLKDGGAYIMRPDPARAFIDRHRARIWKPEVCDCDTRTMCACADLADVALKLEWERGAGIVDLWYTSKTLGLPHTSRLSGYHSAPAILVQNEKGDDVELFIVQPKVLRADLSESPAKWATPEQEVREWVFAVGMV